MRGLRALPRDDFIAWLRHEGRRRYHDRHPYHRRMHAGELTRTQLREWVRNRFYYQTRIPIKDALILAKSEDSAFRRMWIHRIQDHDGGDASEGGIERWLRLGEAVGLSREELLAFEGVLPGVRFACDGYVQLVREGSLLEAVASSLTEAFASDLMSERIRAWEGHYPWVATEGLDYFRSRVPRARADSEEAIAFVAGQARTYKQQAAAVNALIRKTDVLWGLLDALHLAYVQPIHGAREIVP